MKSLTYAWKNIACIPPHSYTHDCFYAFLTAILVARIHFKFVNFFHYNRNLDICFVIKVCQPCCAYNDG